MHEVTKFWRVSGSFRGCLRAFPPADLTTLTHVWTNTDYKMLSSWFAHTKADSVKNAGVLPLYTPPICHFATLLRPIMRKLWSGSSTRPTMTVFLTVSGRSWLGFISELMADSPFSKKDLTYDDAVTKGVVLSGL